MTDPRQGGPRQGPVLPEGLLTSLPAAVAYLAGPDLVIEFASEAYRDLLGGREVLGRPIREAVPEVAEQGRLEMLQRILRTGEPVRGSETEVRVRRHGRSERLFVDYFYQPVRDADGAIAGVLLYAADVTAHVRDRRRLQALTRKLTVTEERYRALFETMPQGVIHFRADGSVSGANPAATRILGLDARAMTTWPLGTGRQAVHENGSPYPPEELPVPTALRTGEVVPDVVVGVPHAQTGEVRWLQVTAVPDARNRTGRPQRAYAIFSDLTGQFRMEAALREGTVLLGRLRDANVLGVVVAGEEGIQDANDAFLDIIGYQRTELAQGRMSLPALTPPEWAECDRGAMAQLRRTGAAQPYDKEFLHRDGHRVPVLVGGATVSWRPFQWVNFVVDLSARQRAEQERAELLVRERAARAEADQARERLTFLLHAGAMAAATADRQELLQQLTRLVVPSLADYCMVFLPTGDGKLQAAALTHRDPQRAAVLSQLREQPLPLAGPLPVQAAYASGSTQLVPDVGTEMPAWTRAAPDVTATLAKMDLVSAVAVPLTARQQRLGVMVMCRGPGRPRFAATDLEMMEELGRRLAAGLAAATTFALEHTIAETLQRSLLPVLPAIPGVDLAVRYLPATTGADIGGDWYDVFEAGGGQVVLVIGDVVGHSIASASVMGQIRSMLRAYAIHQPHPLAVLRRTGRAVGQLLPAALATVTCGLLNLSTGEFGYASAGHPPPLLIKGDGHTEFLGTASGIMLGAAPDPRLRPARRRLQPGDGVLFYTDGLVEGRDRDLSDGLAALAGALAGHPGRTANQICATAQSALLGEGVRSDDVCLLAARYLG